MDESYLSRLSESQRKEIKDRWEQECIVSKKLDIVRLTSDASPSALQGFLEDWKTRERVQSRRVSVARWSGLPIFGLPALIAVLWPWLLFLRRRSEWQKFSKWLRPAVVLQLILVAIFSWLIIGGEEYLQWQMTQLSAFGLLSFAIGAEIFHQTLSKHWEVVDGSR